METKNKLKLYLKDLNLRKKSFVNYKGLDALGYKVYPGFLSDEELKEYQLRFDELYSDHRIPVVEVGSDRRIFGVERFRSNFMLESHKLFVEKVNKDVKYLADNTHFILAGYIEMKVGELGSGGGWHRDSCFTNQFKTIIYLSDVGKDNGAFEYLRGSHKRESFGFVSKAMADYKFDQNRFSDNEIKNIVATCETLCLDRIEGKAGDMILVNTRGIHRGSPLISGSRKAITSYSFRNRVPEKFFIQ